MIRFAPHDDVGWFRTTWKVPMKQYHVEEGEETITIEIGKNAALVLSDLLWRWDRSGLGFTIQMEHDAEWHALGFIDGSLETQLVEPFKDDYLERVEAARRKLVAWCGKIERDEADSASPASE
jgi:hypothetical protein